MNKNIKIGKFTLESLTTGMYSDPKIIFREYIQNSTDAIDAAIKFGLLSSREEGRINIKLDSKKRNLSITDNGTGIVSDKVWNTLCNVGSSEKDFSKQRGFRGIGRLGGLSYANELRFITSAKYENKKTIISWDCDKLKKLLRPGEYEDYDLTRVIQEVTKIQTENEEDKLHYFTVELNGIETQFSELVNEEEVTRYVSQVAPIPFHAQYFVFYHDSETGIKKQLKQMNKDLEEYYIYVNDNPNPIYKPYKNFVKVGNKGKEKRDDIKKIKYIIEKDENGNIVFWGWYGITGFLGQIKEEAIAGLRVRKNNIQIGGAKTLENCFTQNRFNKWFVGEIYVYDENIIPNARRDDFEKNESYLKFIKKLKKYTKDDLSKIPYAYSEFNTASRKIKQKSKELEEIKNTVKEGLSSEIERKELHNKRDRILKEIKQNKNKIKKAKNKIDDSKTSEYEAQLNKANEIENMTKEIENHIIDADYEILKNKALAGYSKKEKKVVIKIFEIIDRELDAELAKKLEMIIIENLKHNKKE